MDLSNIDYNYWYRVHRVADKPVLICFSHLRWNFVFQRPQQIMSRIVRYYQVLFWEEPVFEQREDDIVTLSLDSSGVVIARPRLAADTVDDVDARLARLLEGVIGEHRGGIIRWYYTPMMVPFTSGLEALCTVYDCMDQLANFRFAPPEITTREAELIAAADLLFTGGRSLYEAKRPLHRATHQFSSSVDIAHFGQARALERKSGAAPQLGYYGVIDERIDLALIARVADLRPEWTFHLVGPLAKIAPEDVPVRPNIRVYGQQPYAALPGYLADWDVALMPFALNEATRFISPTKTPEYLAAGTPVVSTPIADVVSDFGSLTGVMIAGDAEAFVAACERALEIDVIAPEWLEEVDRRLAEMSWDSIVRRMAELIGGVIEGRRPRPVLPSRLRRERYDYLIVGAGFAGSVLAERLANDAGARVLLIDRRDHVAGNAYDHDDAAGVRIHRYGPHIFHTNSAAVIDYLSAFTRWRHYEHRVLADLGDRRVPIPINRTTLNRLFGVSLRNDAEAAAFLAARAEAVDPVLTSEDVVVAAVGRELYETFFRGYTRKQWGLDPSQLDRSVTARVPTRTNCDDRYFTDRFQQMPADGYTRMFENMLDHSLITLALGVDYRDVAHCVSFDRLIFTGPIDEFFNYRYGPLPYRSLRFDHQTIDTRHFQETAVVNYPDPTVPWTRITEYKHLTGQQNRRTSITIEYPAATGDPYYPVPRPENQQLFKRYQALADLVPDTIFVGRLATYRYYNMDQVVGQALATYARIAPAQGRRLVARPAAADDAMAASAS